MEIKFSGQESSGTHVLNNNFLEGMIYTLEIKRAQKQIEIWKSKDEFWKFCFNENLEIKMYFQEFVFAKMFLTVYALWGIISYLLEIAGLGEGKTSNNLPRDYSSNFNFFTENLYQKIHAAALFPIPALVSFSIESIRQWLSFLVSIEGVKGKICFLHLLVSIEKRKGVKKPLFVKRK